jgi:aminocarboxymuconate-semialdehyde decarboxylase
MTISESGAVLDMHTHVVPLGLPIGSSGDARWPVVDVIDPGHAQVMVSGRPFRTVTRASWDMLHRVEEMEAAGIGRHVLSPMPELFSYWADAGEAFGFTRYVNEWLAGAVADDREHFSAFGVVPLQSPDVAAESLSEIGALGLAGVEVGTNINGVAVADRRFDEFFAEAERLGLAVFVHAFKPHDFDSLSPQRVARAITFPNEVGMAALALVANGVPRRFPSLRIGLSHGGGTAAYGVARLDNAYRTDGAIQEALQESPVTSLRRMYYDCLVFSPRALRYLLDTVGGGRVMRGSDYPFMPISPLPSLAGAPVLAPAEMSCIDHHNPREFLRLGDSSPVSH